MPSYDSIIIGFGKGGKTLAATFAAGGQSVALIEKSTDMYGGTCINTGCIPSKSLIHSAAAAVHKEDKAQAYRQAVQEKRALTSMLRKKNYEKLCDKVTIIDGTASFIGPTLLNVKTAEGELHLSANNFYINTGSVPVIPKIPGIINNPHIYYSDTMMELETLPQELVIIGGGYVGLEFASMYANFGANVTVLNKEEVFLPREDRDIANAIKEMLQEQGIAIYTGSEITRIESDIVCFYHNGRLHRRTADVILLATGRRPNTDGLNLSHAKVKTKPNGGIITDQFLQTTQHGIFALGDVRGEQQFTYVSLDDYRIIKSEGGYNLTHRKNIPYSVFMAVPYARVGMSEKEAAESGLYYRTVKLPVSSIPKAQVLRKPVGLMKALIDKQTNRILGAMLFCEQAPEIINIIKIAMDVNANYTMLRDEVFTHPTMSEALNDLFAL